MQQKALIIFVKNPALGKVKTRLAATLGNEKALEIYNHLLKHTQQITENLSTDKWVFYDNFIDENDLWKNEIYRKSLQLPMVDLGQKMANAFWDMIQEGYERIAIIGSDCLELSEEILVKTYSKLADYKQVIGPAKDGGYYLIGFDFAGMSQESITEIIENVFLNKEWSHENVFKEAIEAFEKLQLTYAILPMLTDVDEAKDLLNSGFVV
jgi:uncharacterized protein